MHGRCVHVHWFQECVVHRLFLQAVACITHLQPCHPTTHATQICR
jgi:hypothetical protein